MLSMSVHDATGTRTLSVSFLEARDAGREVRFAVFDRDDPIRISEIVASSVALGTSPFKVTIA